MASNRNQFAGGIGGVSSSGGASACHSTQHSSSASGNHLGTSGNHSGSSGHQEASVTAKEGSNAGITASNAGNSGNEEEDMSVTERELAEDAAWKRIQQNTFTRWLLPLSTTHYHLVPLSTSHYH